MKSISQLFFFSTILFLSIAVFGCAGARQQYVTSYAVPPQASNCEARSPASCCPEGNNQGNQSSGQPSASSESEWQVIQGGDVGPFGADNSWGAFVKKGHQPSVYRLESDTIYDESNLSWDGCRSSMPNRHAKNVHQERKNWHKHEWHQELAGGSHTEVIPLAGGSNASTGNIAIPAAETAAGVATAGFAYPPNNFNVSQSGANAYSKSNSNRNSHNKFEKNPGSYGPPKGNGSSEGSDSEGY